MEKVRKFLIRLLLYLIGEKKERTSSIGKMEMIRGQVPHNVELACWAHKRDDGTTDYTYEISMWYPKLSIHKNAKYDSYDDAVAALTILKEYLDKTVL